MNIRIRIKTTVCCALITLMPLLVVVSAHAFPIRMGLAPDNNQNILLSEIRAARAELKINIYQLESSEIAQAICERIRSGVATTLLVEGEPFGQMSSNEKTALAMIAQAIHNTHARAKKNSRLWIMQKPASEQSKRRYRWDHAKYVLIDGQRALISSENFSANGHPTAGLVGNRGWDVVVQNSALVDSLEAVFAEDTDPRYGDVREVTPSDFYSGNPGAFTSPTPRSAPRFSESTGDATRATLILSPHSVDKIVTMIRNARERIEVEQMSLPSHWRKDPSPIVTELIRAAQRGVRVRVLLNDDRVWSQPQPAPDPRILISDENPSLLEKKGNELTRDVLTQVAESEQIPLEARIVNIKQLEITYIHNKGFVVDGRFALVSSINGTQNSFENNREVAILLESADAARYYGGAFEWDWKNSVTKAFQKLQGSLNFVSLGQTIWDPVSY